MSNQSYEQADSLMRQQPELCNFFGARSEENVQAVEEALGLALPPTYKRFLREYGAGAFGSSEIYGIVDDNLNNPGTPDVVWHTLSTRTKVDMPLNYVIIYAVGDGEVFCISCSSEGGSPIIAFTPGLSMDLQPLEVMANDFGDFLLEQVQQNIAWQSL